jgi:ribosomal protein L16 Arg81 hydroxylase
MNEIREILEIWEIKTYTLEMDTGGVLSHKVQKLSADTVDKLEQELSALIKSEEQVKEILRLFVDEYRKVMLIQIESDRKREYERLEDKIIKAICSNKEVKHD